MGAALTKGASMARAFINERFVVPEADVPQTSLYDALQKSWVKTMADMRRKVKVRHKDVTTDGEVMYLRLLAVKARKKVPLKRVLSFENAPVPLSLFTEDDNITTCAKSDFMHKVEELIPGDKHKSVDTCDALLFDGHTCIQMLPSPTRIQNMPFKDMPQRCLSYILHCSGTFPPSDVQQIHVVFDKYLEDSIKAQTRATRGERHDQVYRVKADVPISQNGKPFLSYGENKASLAKYYIEYITNHAPALLKEWQALYVSGGQDEKTSCISPEGVKHVTALSSTRKEADTRLVLHAVAAAENRAQTIVVQSPDTDVLVLLVHHRPAMKAKKIFFLTGRDGKHTQLTRYIPVRAIYNHLIVEQKILRSVYRLTGCDTVSAFLGHGKRTAYRVMMQKADQLQDLALLGSNEEPIAEAAKMAATRLVGSMYGKVNCTSLNACLAG